MRPESESPWVLFKDGLIERCMLAEGVFPFAAFFDEFIGNQAFNGGFQVVFFCLAMGESSHQLGDRGRGAVLV
jgi:hypothetical protein